MRRARRTESRKQPINALRELGFRADEVRRAVEFAETLDDVTLEERVRAALKFLRPKPRVQGRIGMSAGAST